MTEPIAETKFKARVVREYSSCASVDDLGERENTARLYDHGEHAGSRGPYHQYAVEWDAGPDLDPVSIGLITRGDRRVEDYDGVFSMPTPIGRFLQREGFDLSELYDSHPELVPVSASANGRNAPHVRRAPR